MVLEAIRRQQRHLRDMADRDAPAPAIFLGLATDIVDLHAVGGFGQIEMHVDLGVELARNREDAVDLCLRIGVEIRRSTNGPRAAAQAFDQEFLGAGIVGEAFLRKYAELDIDRPGIVTRDLADGLEAGHADAGIKLDMGAHAHRAMRDAALQRLLRPCIDVLGGEIALGGGGHTDGFGDGAFLDAAAVENAGLVEMDVRLDQAGHHEAAFRVDLARIGAELRRDRGDRVAVDADVNDAKLAVLQDAGFSNDQIH